MTIERFLMMGGTNYTAEIERTLMGLGFSREDFNRPTSEFSGGWRMRIELAKLLLRRPDVLLLDEPTNHLDIESIQWLENFLKTSAGAVVLVSHDRAFINNVTNVRLKSLAGISMIIKWLTMSLWYCAKSVVSSNCVHTRTSRSKFRIRKIS